MTYVYAEPVVANGSPFERGKTIAAAAGALREGISARMGQAVEVNAEEADWIDAQWQVQQKYLPEMCDLMDGLAAGFGIDTRQLFHRHVTYAIEDRRRSKTQTLGEECTSFAIRTERGALVAKNRDNPPSLKPLQSLVLQKDPAWGGRSMLSIGSFGSSPAASSGINSDGLCMTDTSVRTLDIGLGVLRYYLMDAILYRCGTVAEAVDFIRSIPHLGGGNILLGDAGGHIAAIEIGHGKVAVEQDPASGWVARTNHFLDRDLEKKLVNPSGTPQREDSASRLAFVHSRLSGGVANWTQTECMAVLSHQGNEQYAPLCRDTPEVLTLSGAIFNPTGRDMLQSHGRPSGGDWRRTAVPA